MRWFPGISLGIPRETTLCRIGLGNRDLLGLMEYRWIAVGVITNDVAQRSVMTMKILLNRLTAMTAGFSLILIMGGGLTIPASADETPSQTGQTNLVETRHVAQVTVGDVSTPCNSFEEAMDLAQSAGEAATVTLLADVALDLSGYEMRQGTVVLQGGGHTLGTGNGIGFPISGGSLTIASGNVTGTSAGIWLTAGSSGRLTVSDGSIQMVEVYGGRVTLNGGEITILSTRGGSTSLTGGHVAVITSNGGKVERRGGTIGGAEGSTAITYPVDSVTVTGGTRLTVGGGIQLTASHTPALTDGTYATSWTSSDPSVATVDPTGKVTGVKTGVTTIRATVNDTSGMVQVRVGEASTVDKSGLSKLIEEARLVVMDDYTEESYKALEDALASAESVHNSVDATQAEVDAAVSGLQTALESLEYEQKTITFNERPPFVRTMKTYDGSTFLYEGDVPASEYSGVNPDDDVSMKVRAVLDDAEPGEGKGYTITYPLSGKDAHKYKVKIDVRRGNDGVVLKRSLTIEGIELEQKTYDDTFEAKVLNPGILTNLADTDAGKVKLNEPDRASLGSYKAEDTVASITYTVTFGGGLTATDFRNRYEFDGDKYDLQIPSDGMPTVTIKNIPVTIKHRPLTVKVHDQSIEQGEDIDWSAYTVEGLVDGQYASAWLEVEGNAIKATRIDITDGESTTTDNYAITTSDGVLTVYEMHVVTFNPMGGSEIESVQVRTNGNVPEPTPPTRDGHTFLGWWTKETGGDQWDFSRDTITGDTTLWARWRKNGTTPSAPTYRGIQVTSKPGKLEYEVGGQFDPSGLKVSERWSDGSTRTLGSDEYTVSGFDSTKPGKITVTVTLNRDKRHSASFTVTITAGRVDVYRLYNTVTGEHFYTANTVERDHLKANGWRLEGVAFTMGTHGTPVHRLYSADGNRLHMYTTSKAELDALLSAGWRYEGIAWHEPEHGSTKVHRLYNQRNGDHLHTVNPVERQALVNASWRDEGSGFTAL